MNKWKKGILIFLAGILCLQRSTIFAEAREAQYRKNVTVVVDGAEAGTIAALEEGYENNLYLSLKGLAAVLQETPKAFTPVVEKQGISITTGTNDFLEPSRWDEEALAVVGSATAARNKLYQDQMERKYYSVMTLVGEEYDAFFSPISLAMMLDLAMEVTEEKITIDTAASFSISAREMEESGYMQGVNALLIGDGTTGEIFYQYAGDTPFPIASITKLMTYFVFMDAVSQGECALEDKVVISPRAEVLSKGPDGVIPLTEGNQVPVSELLYGMLVLSSNECALAIAEHVAGSQEAFVERMNEKAKALGLENAEFYNPHGLPNYEEQLIPAKTHNHMTAEEMFQLAAALLDTYPQITEYTSVKTIHLETLGRDIRTTNAVLYNMENVVGLKTGTTNKAGACLVTCILAEKEGQLHNLLVVLLGADGEANRGIASEMAARYALEALAKGDTYHRGESEEEDNGKIPRDPEAVVKRLVEGVVK